MTIVETQRRLAVLTTRRYVLGWHPGARGIIGDVAALLTLPDVANELGVSVKTVLGFIRRGDLKALQGIGRGLGYRTRREWVDEFLRGRQVAPATPYASSSAPARRARRAEKQQPSATFTSVRDARAQLGLVRGGKES